MKPRYFYKSFEYRIGPPKGESVIRQEYGQTLGRVRVRTDIGQ